MLLLKQKKLILIIYIQNLKKIAILYAAQRNYGFKKFPVNKSGKIDRGEISSKFEDL